MTHQSCRRSLSGICWCRSSRDTQCSQMYSWWFCSSCTQYQKVCQMRTKHEHAVVEFAKQTWSPRRLGLTLTLWRTRGRSPGCFRCSRSGTCPDHKRHSCSSCRFRQSLRYNSSCRRSSSHSSCNKNDKKWTVHIACVCRHCMTPKPMLSVVLKRVTNVP